MNRLKRLWNRLPKLPRRWRIVRNLAAAVLLLLLVLHWGRWPGWAGYSAYRLLEAKYLLTPSRVVCMNYSPGWNDVSAFLTEGEGWIAAGKSVSVDSGGLYRQARPNINHVVAKEGIVAVALPGPDRDNAMTVAVWGAPEGAESGALELDLEGVDGGVWTVTAKETFAAQARRREDGWFLFTLAPHQEDHGGYTCAMAGLWVWDALPLYHSVREFPYRLTLYDSQGEELLFQAGTLPPNLNLFDR